MHTRTGFWPAVAPAVAPIMASIVAAIWLLLASGCNQTQSAPTATPLPTATIVPTPAPNTLYVDAAQPLGAISPYVYGANYGPWMAVPLDLMPQAETAGFTYLRFPGGNWGDLNDLRPYQIDQYITLAQRLGAEPSISVRLRGGTPEQAAELVHYTNIEQGYGVRYWSIGNEPSLYDDYDTERYNQDWRQFAQAMEAVDPDILLVGPDTHQYTGDPDNDPVDENGRDWVRAFLEANGDLVDVVAVHRYPFPTSMTATTSIADLRANSREWDQIIPTLRALVQETTGRDLPIAITEVNSHWSNATGGEATTDSFYNAIWWSDVLGRMIRQRVDIVAHFALQSSNSIGGFGLLARYEVRPTYYVYQLYQKFGAHLLHASTGDPHISVYAAQRDDGALTLMVINLGPDEVTRSLRIDGLDSPKTADVWRLDAEHNAEQIGRIELDDRIEITLPGASATLYILTPSEIGRR